MAFIMITKKLEELGERITRLRIGKNLKQSELAYEAGISERTLQRIEAGEVVKSDGLLKVIAYLGRLDELLEALNTPDLSPYELANRPAKYKAGGSAMRARVRSPKKSNVNKDSAPGNAGSTQNSPGEIIWPEDQT
jgi:transcriptional regulator with XRE-family HTH domain